MFPKAISNDDVIRTNSGGLLTIVSVLFLFYMLIYEIIRFKEIKIKEQIIISQNNTGLLEFTGNLIVYNKCDNLYFTLTDKKRTTIVEPINLSISKVEKGPKKCNIKFSFFTPNVPGCFHVGLGDSYKSNFDHRQIWYTISERNISHKIVSLNINGLPCNSSLDGYQILLNKKIPYMIVYNMQLIPHRYKGADGFKIISTLNKLNLEKAQSKGIPGIFFEWNFVPIGIETVEFHESLIDLIFHYLRIFGCFFILIRAIDIILFYIPPCFHFHKY